MLPRFTDTVCADLIPSLNGCDTAALLPFEL